VSWVESKRAGPILKMKLRLEGGGTDSTMNAAHCNIVGLVPFMIMTIHTFGEYLDFHPHLHALVADGLFSRESAPSQADSPDATFHLLPECPIKPLEELFRAKVIRFLENRNLLPPERARSLRSWVHSGRPDAAPNSRLFQAFQTSILLRSAKPTRAFPIPGKKTLKKLATRPRRRKFSPNEPGAKAILPSRRQP
jgi:hypothetical protein